MSIARAIEDLVLAAFSAFALLGCVAILADKWLHRGDR